MNIKKLVNKNYIKKLKSFIDYLLYNKMNNPKSKEFKAIAMRNVVDVIKKITIEAKEDESLTRFKQCSFGMNNLLTKVKEDFDEDFVYHAILYANKELGFTPFPLHTKWVQLMLKNGCEINNVEKVMSYDIE